MTLIGHLSFAVENRPRFFSPGFDVEVFDTEEEEWHPLIGSTHSLESLVEGVEAGDVDESHVRFSNDEVEDYLDHLCETGIDDQVHQEEQLDRSQLVALADAGYTAPEDFIGTDDALDIESETGVDRDLIQSIASNYIGGFSNAGSFGSGGLLEDLDPRDDLEGWQVVSNSDSLIRWSSAGRFRLTIKPTPRGDVTVTTNAPNEGRSPWYRKGWSPGIGEDGAGLSPSEALTAAHDWLEANELVFDDDLATLPRIGPATKDYLAITYDVSSVDDLREFIDANPDEVEEIFGEERTQLIDHLEQRKSE